MSNEQDEGFQFFADLQAEPQMETERFTLDDQSEDKPTESVAVDTTANIPTRDMEQRPNKAADIQAQHDRQAPKYVTKGGKEIKIVKDVWGTFWHVEFTSGGQLPAELMSKFTSEKEADLAIRVYLAK